MAAFLHDTFTHDSNSVVGLNTHAPETGGAWVFAGTKFAAQNFDTFIYPDDYVSSIGTTPINCCYNNVTPPSEDVKVTFQARRGTNTSDTNVGLWLRCNPTAENAYRLVWDNLRVTVHRVNARSYTSLGQSTNGTGIPYGPTPVSVEVKIVGATITVYHNGVLVLNITDPSPLPNGYVGLGVGSQGFIDEITAEDAAGGPAETVGSASGSATVAGAGITSKATTGTATGSASSNMIAMRFQTGFGSITASAVMEGQSVEMLTRETLGSLFGSSESLAVGRAIFTAAGQIVGSADAIGFISALTLEDTEAAAAGQAVVTGFGGRLMKSTGFAIGESVVTGASESTGSSTGVIEGLATMQGAARGFLPGETEGVIVAATEVAGVSYAIKATTGSAAGVTTMQGGAFTGSQGRSAGSGLVTGVGRMIKMTTAVSFGQAMANVVGAQIEGSLADGGGVGQANGIGHAIIATVGTIAGESGSNFLSFGVTLFITPASRTIELSSEDRSIEVRAEDRTIVLSRSIQSAEAELEARTIEVPAEDRTLEVQAEDRTISVNAESREIIL